MTEQELATEHLDIPLFFLSQEAPKNAEPEPDSVVSIALTETVMAELCQVINEGETHCVYLTDYQLVDTKTEWQSVIEKIESVQLHLQKGPQLAVMLVTESGEQFVSPWLEFAPEFDFGLDDEVEGEE